MRKINISACTDRFSVFKDQTWKRGDCVIRRVFCYRNPAETFSYSSQFKLFSPVVTFLTTAQYKSITAQFFLCSSWNKVNISVLLNTHLFLFSPFPPSFFFFLFQEMQERNILVVIHQTDTSISTACLHSIYGLFRV